MFGIDDMLIGSAISGGASLLGGLFAQDKTDQRLQQSQAFSAQQAQQQMDFQERMSNTAYQRSMSDMKAAGLNPIMAYEKGGASSPSGAMASTTAPPASDVVTPALNSAMAATKTKAEVDNMINTNDNILKDTRLKIIQGDEADARRLNQEAETRLKIEDLPVHSARKVEAEIDKGVYESPTGRLARQLGTYGSEVQRGTSALGNVFNPMGTVSKIMTDSARRNDFANRWH